jgi:alpha-glucosidase
MNLLPDAVLALTVAFLKMPRMKRGLFLLGVLFATVLPLGAEWKAQPLRHSAMMGSGLSVFVPDGYDPGQTPSLALKAEPAERGPVPAAWSLRPVFEIDGKQARASVAVPAQTSLYGGGEVSGPLLRNGHNITLWNTDSPGYKVDGGRRLYQSHPWVLGVRPDGSAFGVLFDSSWKAELATNSDRIHFHSQGPPFRVFVIDRESPQAVLRGLAELTGTMSLPPRWALGYQQCRYSYTPDARVREIADTFRRKKIPCDVIWMDIDYMDGFRVFTFSPKAFPDPAGLNRYLHDQGFKAVWMIDPGVKVDPQDKAYRSGTKEDVWVKTAEGKEYHGDVWPGACAFPDFTRPETRQWWAGLYRDFVATGVDGVWNDMNEPAVFNVATGTMPEDNWHRGGGDLPPGPHLLYHNVYGRLMAQGTWEGLLAAQPDRRPFVLSRANFIGGQRYAAAWTGDNRSSWKDLKLSVPMSLTLGLSGQPFNGPDIGGFLSAATPELWGHWIGFGAFFPFARGHACNGTPDKEPWAFGPEVEAAARIALERRYRLLPYFYTLFRDSSVTGLPVMQPVFFADPQDPGLRAEEQAFLIGSDLLVVPAFAQDPRLPRGIWRPLHLVEGDGGPYQAQLKIRGGSIIPAGVVVQHTGNDSFAPLTLMVCPDKKGEAVGYLYRDAGNGWGFQKGEYLLQRLVARPDGRNLVVQIDSQEGNLRFPGETAEVEMIVDGRRVTGRGSLQTGISMPRP